MNLQSVGRLLVLAVAAVVVWLAAPELEWPPRAMLTFLVVALPALMIAQTEILAREPEIRASRMAAYASSMIGLWFLAGLTVMAAFAGRFGAADLGLTLPSATGTLALWSAAATVGGIGIMLAAHAIGMRESHLLRELLPRTAGERVTFVGVSITAGMTEEFVFRGFLIPAIELASGSLIVAVALSSIVFGLAHTYQRVSGAVRATVLGAALAVPLLFSGSLLPSVVAHAAIDIVGGLWLGPRLVD